MYQPTLVAALLAAAVGELSGCSDSGLEREVQPNRGDEPPPKEAPDCSNRSECEDPAPPSAEPSPTDGSDIATGKCVPPSAIELPEPDQEDEKMLSAVGILERLEGEELKPFCTGSLIGRNKVLTACHCVEESTYNSRNTLWFRRDSDRIKVVDHDPLCDPSLRQGGFNDVGSDVAVMFLEEHADEPDVPLEARNLIEDDIKLGAPLTTIGYFFQRSGNTQGGADRQVTKLALRAIKGQFLKEAFKTSKNFNNCLAEYSNEDTATGLRFEDWIRIGNWDEIYRKHTWGLDGDDMYWQYTEGFDGGGSYRGQTNGFDGGETFEVDDLFETSLYENYQAWFDGGPDGMQPCKGDSGGPLLRRTDEGFAVYGVVSGSIVLDASEPRCAFGAVYAIFTEETLKWLQGLRAPQQAPNIDLPTTLPSPGVWTAATDVHTGRVLTTAGTP